MKFKLEIDCNNAAFGEDDFERDLEVTRIIRTVPPRLESKPVIGCNALRDFDGNTVGSFEFVA